MYGIRQVQCALMPEKKKVEATLLMYYILHSFQKLKLA